jgi:hypothetical protein
MADTRRTVAALQALLADNVAGDISPQDVRDFLVSTAPAYGALYISSPAASTISVAGTPVKAAGTTAEVASHSDVTVATTNRLTYTAAPDIDVIMLMAVSMTCVSSTVTVGISIGKNGTQLAHTEIFRKIGTGTDQGAAATFGFTTLSQNDYVEMFVSNEDDTGNVTLTKGVFAILGVLT